MEMSPVTKSRLISESPSGAGGVIRYAHQTSLSCFSWFSRPLQRTSSLYFGGVILLVRRPLNSYVQAPLPKNTLTF